MPKRTTGRAISDVLGALMTAQAGVMAGEQQARQRQLEEQELARRRKMQDDDQLFQAFNQGARLEDQAIQDERAPYEAALRNPRVANPDELLQHLMQPRQRQFGPEAFAQSRATGQLPAFKPVRAPMPGGPVAPTPRIIPQEVQDAYDVPIQMREKRLAEGVADPNEAAFTQRELTALRKGRAAGTPYEKAVVGEEYGLPLKVRPTLPEGEDEKYRKEQQRLQRDAIEEDRQWRRDEAKRRSDEAAAEHARQEEGRLRDDARARETAMQSALQAAIKSGNPTAILRAGGDLSAHRRANSKYLPVSENDPFDPTPRMLERMGPVAQQVLPGKRDAFGKIVPGSRQGEMVEGPIYEQETKDQIAARQLKAAQELAESPLEQRKLVMAQIPRLLAIAKDPKISSQSRQEALDSLGTIAETVPGLPGIFSKQITFDPILKEKEDAWRVREAARVAQEARKVKADEAELSLKQKRLTELDKRIAQLDTKVSDAAQRAAQKEALGLFKGQAKDATKTLDALYKQPEWQRSADWQQQVDAAKGKYDQAMVNFNEGLASGDAVAPIRADAIKQRVMKNIDRATKLNGGPLTQAQINAISRAVRGQASP